MLRADMDALPIKEEADLPYRSKAIKKDKDDYKSDTFSILSSARA